MYSCKSATKMVPPIFVLAAPQCFNKILAPHYIVTGFISLYFFSHTWNDDP